MEGIEQFSRIEGPGGLAGSIVGFGGATQIAALPRLKAAGFLATMRYSLGADIAAACGQLAQPCIEGTPQSC